ncbi:MAG: hypothetical protein R3F17_12255 [Planctomycetota bacterium]
MKKTFGVVGGFGLLLAVVLVFGRSGPKEDAIGISRPENVPDSLGPQGDSIEDLVSPAVSTDRDSLEVDAPVSEPQTQVPATDNAAEEDRTSWTMEDWNYWKIDKYETEFRETGSTMAMRMMTHISIAAILDADGRAADFKSNKRVPVNSATECGFQYNNNVYFFSPGEFPEYDWLVDRFNEGGKLAPGEVSKPLDDSIKAQALGTAERARMLLARRLGK